MAETAELIERARNMLAIARNGLGEARHADRRRFIAGAYNVAVYGRMVTFVLQTARTESPSFDAWYGPWQERLMADPVARYFVQLRNKVEKQGGVRHATSMRIDLGPHTEVLMRNPPPFADSFFIGDDLGGVGWMVKLPDGTTDKVYVQVPPEIASTIEMTVRLDPDNDMTPEGDFVANAEHYLDLLDELVTDAARWASI